jgi:hypothetical protein
MPREVAYPLRRARLGGLVLALAACRRARADAPPVAAPALALELIGEHLRAVQRRLPVDLLLDGGVEPRPLRPLAPFGAGRGVELAFRGEFGYEMIALGFAFYASLAGAPLRVRGCGPMGAFYAFYAAYTDDERCTRGVAVGLLDGALAPGPLPKALGKWHDMLLDRLPRVWLAPPLREFHSRAARDERWPLADALRHGVLVISNKFTSEFFVRAEARGGGREARGPTNFYSVESVQRMIDAAVRLTGLTVVYNRPGALVPQDASATGQLARAFGDKAMIEARARNRSHPWHERVRLVEALERPAAASYNDVLVRALALSRCVVAVQGGSGWLSSHLGAHVTVLHRAGLEGEGAYQRVMPLLGLPESLTVARTAEHAVEHLEALLARGACTPPAAAAATGREAARRPPPSAARVVRAVGLLRQFVDAQPTHDFGPNSTAIFHWPPRLPRPPVKLKL